MGLEMPLGMAVVDRRGQVVSLVTERQLDYVCLKHTSVLSFGAPDHKSLLALSPRQLAMLIAHAATHGRIVRGKVPGEFTIEVHLNVEVGITGSGKSATFLRMHFGHVGLKTVVGEECSDMHFCQSGPGFRRSCGKPHWAYPLWDDPFHSIDTRRVIRSEKGRYVQGGSSNPPNRKCCF